MKNALTILAFIPLEKKVVFLTGFIISAMIITAGLYADVPHFRHGKLKVENKIPIKAYAFDLRDVRLLDGPFRHAQELDHQYLLSLDPDRLLHNFRINAGLASSAQPLGGWEAPDCELRGHFVGHYLSACAMMYASTDDLKLKERTAYIVDELAKCQDKIFTRHTSGGQAGYLSAYPEEFLDRVETGKRVWAPWYTLHKIYAGLVDAYLLCDNEQALKVALKMADWAKARADKLSEEQMQKMLGVEHGGMNDALAEIYAVTGDQKYLKLAQRFNHRAVLEPLSQREDKLTGLHANTQFPKVIGAARQYELTGDGTFHTMATYFWGVVTKERSYVIGGNSDGEHFSPKEELSKHIGPTTTETCNTYNMLKLTRHLFCWEPKAEYSDYYERALYNHILASQNPEDGMMCYYVPLKTRSTKTFSGPLDAFWCCVGTGVENHAKYGDSIYFCDGDRNLYLNLFIASELNWKDKGVKIRQETKYPLEAATHLIFTCEKPVEMNLNIRHPYWAVEGIQVVVNGKKESFNNKPGSYLTLSRVWKSGDTVNITMPMTLRIEAFRDDHRKLALMYGPLVLCAELDRERGRAKPCTGSSPPSAGPALVGEDELILSSIKPVAGKSLTFTGLPAVFRSVGAKADVAITLVPFYQMYNKPYIVYWDRLAESQWKEKEKQYKAEAARQKELEARTIDKIDIGQEQSEREHELKGEKTQAGDFGNRMWRHAVDGGWFSFAMKVLPEQPIELMCTYWGSDSNGREFDILIDGTKITTQVLNNNSPDKFFDVTYLVPQELTKGKEKVTLRFQGHEKRTAGGVFGCRIVRRK
jgi:hypothetical protein